MLKADEVETMNFAAPWYLLLLLLVPVAIWILRSLEGQRRKTALEYADPAASSGFAVDDLQTATPLLMCEAQPYR